MKVSISLSLDLEVVEELAKRKLGSKWVNKLLRRELGLEEVRQ